MPQECLLSRWRAIIILVPIKDLARCHAQVSVLYIARVGMKVLDMARLIDVRERCRFRIGLVRRETSITVSSSSSSSSWSSSNGGLRKQLATLSIRRLFMRNFLLDNHFRANDKNKPFLQTKTATFGSTFERKPFLSKRKLHFNKLSKQRCNLASLFRLEVRAHTKALSFGVKENECWNLSSLAQSWDQSLSFAACWLLS